VACLTRLDRYGNAYQGVSYTAVKLLYINNIKCPVLLIHIIYEMQLSLQLHLQSSNEFCCKIL